MTAADECSTSDMWLYYDHQIGRWIVNDHNPKVVRTGAEVIHVRRVGAVDEAGERNKLASLIGQRLLGVRPDDQDLALEDADWRLIIDALSAQEKLAEAVAFANSFRFSVAENSFYKDAYLHIIDPDSVHFRLGTGSQFSKFLSALEDRRAVVSKLKGQRIGAPMTKEDRRHG